MYRIILHRRAKKFLFKIQRPEIKNVVSRIDALSHDPFDPSLDVKKLATAARSYRLRVGSIRVVYEVDKSTKKILIHDIDFRGSVY